MFFVAEAGPTVTEKGRYLEWQWHPQWLVNNKNSNYTIMCQSTPILKSDLS
ncbi:hypothetical protein FD04_GL000523 [Secundilactobacillus odoratitofui DSM 19909 = JCM 15043]|uniref:Uncharacterized protein n=1 Tax=Secundilactobacillus odoratitofui DSM 19909 = JCM 15043 TaxID=1423776 RepID=A0A0R1LSP9_9LACO|nr:hypothetical protein FD04_GL000523 [Secundilactobacillus odoratitofui DSM 19909 = JCM 15043]